MQAIFARAMTRIFNLHKASCDWRSCTECW